MSRLLLLLSVVAIAAAGNYKGLQVKKVGKKTYKCNLNINYNVSPPKCSKSTAKCRPNPKKPIKFTVNTDDAKLTFAVQNQKVKGCKVVPDDTAVSPGGSGGNSPSPGGGSGNSPSPGGGGGNSPSPGGGSGNSPSPGGGSGNSPSPGGGSGNSPFPPIISPGPGNSEHMSCNCRMPLLEQPAGVAHRNLDLAHAIARIAKAKEGEDRARPKEVMAHAIARIAKAKEGEERARPEEARAVERTFTLPSVPADLASLVPVLLIAFVSAIVGILKGMLLSSVAAGRSLVEEIGAEQANILEKLKDRQGIEGLFGGILGGNGGGGNNGGIEGLLGGILSGNGGVEEALVSTMIQNMINQIISNPESLQEMINLAVNSGLAEQVVTNLINTGEINTLIQSLVDSGAAPDIIGNFGNGLVQELLNNNALGNLNIGEVTQMLEESLSSMGDGMGSMLAGVDVQNMELNMQCSCIKEDPVIFPLPGK